MEACGSKKAFRRLPCKSHELGTFTVYELLYLTDSRNDQRTRMPSVFRFLDSLVIQERSVNAEPFLFGLLSGLSIQLEILAT